MAELRVDFDGDESYQTGGTPIHLGYGFGHGELEGYRLADGLVILNFSKGIIRKIPAHRLLRITEG